MIRTVAALLAAWSASMIPGLLVKATLLVGAAGLGSVLLRRRAAAVRHFAWALAILGTLALTAASPIAPTVAVPFPGWQPAAEEAPSRDVLRLLATADDLARTRVSLSASADKAPATIGRSAGIGAAARAAGTAASAWPLAEIWIGGCVALLLWCVSGHLGLARLARAARPLDGSEWNAALTAAMTSSGVERSVFLLCSDAIGAPVTWGWRRPFILLPNDADAWPAERRNAVLMHELAHVARGDYVTQLAATIACAIYWFHPLVWVAARRLRGESELACDDRVLAGGTPASEYALQLLAVARGARALRFGGSVAVGMARRSHLEGRLLAVLDEARLRRGVSSRARGVATAVLGVALIPFAGLRPASRPVPAPAPVASTVEASVSSTTATAPASNVRQTRAATADSVIERSISASPGGRLTLDLETGGGVVVRGWDQARVTVRAELRGRDWHDTRVTIDRDGDGVRVRSVQRDNGSSYSTSHHFEIRVPRRFDVQVASGGGHVAIVNVEGTLRGHSGGGGLELDRVSGTASLTTGGGDITVTDSDIGGRVSTGGGLVTLSRVRGGLEGSSGSGPVIYTDGSGVGIGRGTGDISSLRVGDDGSTISGGAGIGTSKGQTIGVFRGRADRRQGIESGASGGVTSGAGAGVGGGAGAGIAGGVGGRLVIARAGGDIDLDDAPNGAAITTGGGRVTVRGGVGLVSASTGGGNIDIGPIAGSVHASTGAGTIHVTLADAGGDEQTVDVSSGSGHVVIELPAHFDGRIDLETSYTRSFGRATTIETGLALERESTTTWDDREGTPRRYVRARGVVGSGRGLVRVKTVNGDIEVRRAR
jgi:beta-lactamase regulating signal transducer with metallopeptidase domain